MVSIVGKTFVSIDGMKTEDNSIRFTTDTNEVFDMFHDQDCCETVELIDIIGDKEDLLHTPILSYECVQNADEPSEHKEKAFLMCEDSETWTFYKFSTIKGSVTLRWYGTSNGYYSEKVSFKLVNPEKRSYNWEDVT